MKTTRNCRLAFLAAALGMAAQVGLHAAVVNSVDALRAAIAVAEPGEVIRFDSSLSGQVLDITGPQIVLAHDLTIDASGLSEPITLFGHRNEANESFVFVVSAGATVNLSALNFRTDDAPVIDNAGALTIASCLFTNASMFAGWGGAQNQTNGVLTVVDSTFSKCSFGISNLGGAAYIRRCKFNEGTVGAGIAAVGGSIEVADSAFAANNLAVSLNEGFLLFTNSNISAGGRLDWNKGLGIHISAGQAHLASSAIVRNGVGITNSGSLRIDDCTIATNFGGIQNVGTLVVSNSQFIGNTGREGAAVWNSGEFIAANTLFQSNAADRAGGALANQFGSSTLRECRLLFNSGLEGGAIYNNGSLVASDCLISQNQASVTNGYWDRGGALFSGSGAVTLTRCELTQNSALTSGAIHKGDGQMTISQSRISNNTAGFKGGQFVCEAGAIYNVAGDLVIEDSTISSNHIGSYYVSTYVYPGPGLPPMLVFFEIDGAGGGLLTSNGKVAINRCTIAFNHGSGIYQRQAPESSGRVDVRNSTIVSNIVFGADGASSTLLGGLGGGIYSAGVMQVEHSTIVGNRAVNSGSAPTRGGGIYTIQPVSLINSILANNTASQSPDLDGAQNGSGNLISTEPRLAPLGDYGGPTQTMPLLLDSPARDAGGATLLVIDQRGLPRLAGSKPDIGAVELDLSAPDQPLHLMQVRRTASGSIEIRVAASGSLRVVASSDPTALRDTWDYLGLTTETPPGSGFFRFEDKEATKAPQRFYLLLDR